MDEFLQAVESFADLARAEVARAVAEGLHVKRKEDGSPVSDVDVNIERMMRERIRARFPDHGIVGEEFGEESPDAKYRWIIDPIDGTVSYVRGVPLYGTIIALQRERETILGLIDLPGLSERYVTVSGGPVLFNGASVRMGEPDALEHEIIALGARWNFALIGQEAAYDRLSQHYPLTRTWCDAFGHTLAIRGAVGAMVDYGIRLWDIAATKLLVENAGGKYVITHDGPRLGAIFGKPAVVDDILRVLS